MSRGGRQPGAGRPPVKPDYKKSTRGISLPAWLWAWLDEQAPPRGIVIEAALKKAHKLKAPEPNKPELIPLQNVEEENMTLQDLLDEGMARQSKKEGGT